MNADTFRKWFRSVIAPKLSLGGLEDALVETQQAGNLGGDHELYLSELQLVLDDRYGPDPVTGALEDHWDS